MTNSKTFNFARKTGNLSAAIVATAVKYDTVKEFTVKPVDGNRWSFVGYKVTDKMKAKLKDGDTLPERFAVQVPILFHHDFSPKFLDALIADHQDNILHDVADGNSKIDPASVQAIEADYFDTSRNRNAITLADVQKWLDESFLPAIVARMTLVNEALDDSAKRSADAMALIANSFEKHVKGLCGRSIDNLPDAHTINAIRQQIELLIDKDLLQPDDVSEHILNRIKSLDKKPVDVILDAI